MNACPNCSDDVCAVGHGRAPCPETGEVTRHLELVPSPRGRRQRSRKRPSMFPRFHLLKVPPMTEPLHVLVLMTAVSPWHLVQGRWSRVFCSTDTGNLFVLLGPEVGA